MNVIDFISDRALLGEFFAGASWDRWRAVLRAAFALPMTDRDLELFREVAEREPPTHPVSELVAVVGRGGGKDSIASALAAFVAINGDFTRLRPGERGTVLCLANDRDQAAICLRYVRGYFEAAPMLAAMVDGPISGETVALRNRAEVVVATNNYRWPRGRTICAAIYDECATWRSDDSATPDFETDAAVAPGLMRHRGSLKIMISSAYRRVGLFYERWRDCYGKDDPDTLVVLGSSMQFNSTLDQAVIDRELAKDLPRASAEYLCQWRDDLSTFIDRLLVEALIDRGVRERPHDPAIHTYVGFADEAGGSKGGDASTLAVCHKESDGRIIQDLMRVWPAPFVSTDVIAQKADLLKSYRLRTVTMDNWAGALPTTLYAAHGIKIVQADPKAKIYQSFLTVLNSGRMRVLDEPRQIAELCALERRVAWGGHESIDHPQGGHDDAVNALAGAAVLAATTPAVFKISAEELARSRLPSRYAPGRGVDSIFAGMAGGQRVYDNRPGRRNY